MEEQKPEFNFQAQLDKFQTMAEGQCRQTIDIFATEYEKIKDLPRYKDWLVEITIKVIRSPYEK